MAASGEVSGEFFRPRRNRECGWIELKLASGPAGSRPPLDAGWPTWLADALGREDGRILHPARPAAPGGGGAGKADEPGQEPAPPPAPPDPAAALAAFDSPLARLLLAGVHSAPAGPLRDWFAGLLRADEYGGHSAGE